MQPHLRYTYDMSGKTISGGGAHGKMADAGKSPVYLIGGDDEYLVTGKAREIIDSLVPVDEQAFGLEVVDGATDTADEALSSLKRCLEALETRGFLGGGKVIWLRDAAYLSPKTKGRSADTPSVAKGRSTDMQKLVDCLVQLIDKGLPPGQKLVITMAKLDGRSALYKTCTRKGNVLEFSLPEKPKEASQQAADLAMQEFKRFGIEVGRETAQILVERVGFDTRHVTNEVQKLVLYVGNRRKVLPEDVRAIVSAVRETAAWDFADSFGERDLSKALRVLRQLMFQKESHMGLIAGLEKRVGALVVLRTAIDMGWVRMPPKGAWGQLDWKGSPEMEEALKCLGKDDPRTIHPFRALKLAEQAQRFTLSELLNARELVAGTREQMVSTGLPPFLILEFLLTKLLARRRT